MSSNGVSGCSCSISSSSADMSSVAIVEKYSTLPCYLTHRDPILSHYFRGVYASDKLSGLVEDQQWPKKTPYCFIANTDALNQPGEHWVAFYCPIKGPMEYFCSYALPPVKFWSFLEHSEYQNYEMNSYPVQSPTSSVCDQYCLYYLHQRCRGLDMNTCLLPFGTNTDQNDRWVNRWIEQRYGIHLDVYDTYFLKKQISRALPF